MRLLGRLVLTAVTIPLVTGCFTVTPVPVPASPREREALDVRGVVLGPGEGDVVRFEEILDVSWTNDQLFIVGRQIADSGARDVTRQFSVASLSGLLVRQVDAGRTSAVIGGALVGTIATVAILVTGSDPRSR